jgi:hypothetical protein
VTQTSVVASQVVYGTIARQSGGVASNTAINLANGSGAISAGLVASNQHTSLMTIVSSTLYDRMYMSVIDTPGNTGSFTYSFWVQAATTGGTLNNPNASLTIVQLTP